MPLKLMYITNKPEVAEIAQESGVDIVWVDLETLGKEERQHNMNTVKSRHTLQDAANVSKVLTNSSLMVRVNCWNENSQAEINGAVTAGAQLIMLPMWKMVSEVKKFIDAVDGRAKPVLLIETKEAVECLDEVLKLKGIYAFHIGLNDLHLSFGLKFMFQLLSDGTVEKICKKIAAANIPYGFGGIAKIGEGTLPAENIVLEHYRLGSTRAILSRSFCNAEQIGDLKEIKRIFKENVTKLREFEKYAATADEATLNENRKIVADKVDWVVKNLQTVR